MTTAPILFARVGWLDWYDARYDDGPPRRGGAYNESNAGSEVNNYRPIRGRCYGYVETRSRQAGINLTRLGAPPDEVTLDGVLVVHVATQAKGGQVVVGWVRNARCSAAHGERLAGIGGYYNFSALQSDAVLLPLEHRVQRVPKERGAFGQSNVCYGNRSAGWVGEVEPRTPRPCTAQRRCRTRTAYA